jgi:hypothetical protein
MVTNLARVLTFLMGLMVVIARPAAAHTPHTCPPGINDEPTFLAHLEQSDVLNLSFPEVFNAGQRLFVDDMNECDGAGRPGTNGGITPRTPDPLEGPRFTRVSGPEANSCAGCHAQPQAGGAGDFVANVFVLASNAIPVAQNILNPDFSQTFLERNTLGMFGSGAIEELGREMTADLQTLQAQAISQASSTGSAVTVHLTTKGVSFGQLTANPDGSLDVSAVVGVDPDLIIKPFSRKGVQRSVREFTVGAFNQHHGMQATERYGTGTDPDQDGIMDELSVGDITAATIFQVGLPVPIRVHDDDNDRDDKLAWEGEALFSKVGCAWCHLPALPINNTRFCDPNPMNPTTGAFQTFADTTQSYCFDLKRTSLNDGMVHAFTDLKRHQICDMVKTHYCNEPSSTLQSSDSGYPINYDMFLTAKLWDVGNSAPYGHRGDLDTIYAAIINHGGEATRSEGAYEALSAPQQKAIVVFLRTLQMPPVYDDPNPQKLKKPKF